MVLIKNFSARCSACSAPIAFRCGWGHAAFFGIQPYLWVC